MNAACPVCQREFSRGSGYYVGAMYVSYALAVPIIGTLTVVLWYWVLPDWRLEMVAFPAVILFLPLVPMVFRYSRIVWIHLVDYLDPPDERVPRALQ